MDIAFALSRLLAETQLSNSLPMAIHKNSGITYVIYGLIQVGTEPGYKIVKTTDVSANHTYMESGFLLESTRVSGANGSTTDVNLKIDQVNTLLLLDTVIFA